MKLRRFFFVARLVSLLLGGGAWALVVFPRRFVVLAGGIFHGLPFSSGRIVALT
jgi:hypothetical protein